MFIISDVNDKARQSKTERDPVTGICDVGQTIDMFAPHWRYCFGDNVLQ